MNVQEQMISFYNAIAVDPRISVTHISIYMGLLGKWDGNKDHPLELTRHQIMQFAKISARQTFNKCMHELNNYGYIRYIPSTGPYQPGCIYMLKLNDERMKVNFGANQNKM